MNNENYTILKWLIITIVACLLLAFFGTLKNEKNQTLVPSTQVQAQGLHETTDSGATTSQQGPAKSDKFPQTISPVEQEIKDVFGIYYPQAMLLLKGKGEGSCHENLTLNPTALNDNTKWGGVGRDWGIFQINDKWQGVSNVKFLKDPHINIRIAWRIFEDSGYNFHLWTCGRVYGI